MVRKCQDDTNRRLHVAVKPRLSTIITAAQQAYAASGQTAKLQALAEYAAFLDCIDQSIVSDINKVLSQLF